MASSSAGPSSDRARTRSWLSYVWRTALLCALPIIGFLFGIRFHDSFSSGGGTSQVGTVSTTPTSDQGPDLELQRIQRRAWDLLRNPPKEKGRFRLARSKDASGSSPIALDEAQIEAMRAIGYKSGSTTAPAKSGVTIHVPALAFPGLNLETDGHSPAAVLMDMDGNPLHRWQLRFEEAFPDIDIPEKLKSELSFWRRVHLLDNGDLLAIFEGARLIKIDRDSRLIWSYPHAHHAMDVLDDGTIYALTREWEVIPRIKEKGTFDDYIVVLDRDGHERKKVSVLRAIENSSYSALLNGAAEGFDMFHTNAISVLDGTLAGVLPAFKAGNVLISLLKQDAIAVVDMSEEKVVWALSGQWLKQHEPVTLRNGNILLFDNKGNNGRSRVIEFDPITQEIEWLYKGKGRGLLSLTCGANQRLPNGNTLITESDAGRAIEVTKDKKIVWEYYTPHRAGKDKELIATLFDVVRLPLDFPLSWIEEPGAGR